MKLLNIASIGALMLLVVMLLLVEFTQNSVIRLFRKSKGLKTHEKRQRRQKKRSTRYIITNRPKLRAF